MEGILPALAPSAKERLCRHLRKYRDAKLRTRDLIILNLLNHRTPTQIREILSVSRSTVYHVAQRFREWGEAGLIDRREENGSRKLDDEYLTRLHEVTRSSPAASSGDTTTRNENNRPPLPHDSTSVQKSRTVI